MTSTMKVKIVMMMMVVVMMMTVAGVKAQSAGFLSIDVGSAKTQNYTDAATGIVWTPDSLIWPELAEWSTTFTVGPIAPEFADQIQYQSFRYFNSTNPNPNPNPSKFCYALPARSGGYYLLRASFWCGSELGTASGNFASFHIVIDSYVAPQLNFSLPMTGGFVAEYYVKALDGSSSISMCLSALEDAPFVNTIELRPLPATILAAKVIDSSNSALRGPVRYDYGAPANSLPIVRYPDDELDRFWFTTSDSYPTNVTSATIDVVGTSDVLPSKVMQSNVVAAENTGQLLFNFSFPGTHMYFINLIFVELDPNVKAGDRVFDVRVDDSMTASNVDVLNRTSRLYEPYQIYTSTEFGPYVDFVAIALVPSPSSIYPPFLAALELMQVFSDPIAIPTSSNDASSVLGIKSTLPSLRIFAGDPCLPAAYSYPWIECNTQVSPPRITSISLSNYNLSGDFPGSINDLDQLATVLLDGNRLEGPLPDLSNLLYLKVLNLSNNKLSGPIPASLATLTRLTSLDVSNNNFSGAIPAALLQKQGLVFRYEGNSFLCSATNASCSQAESPILPQKKNQTALIIGIVITVLVALIVSVAIATACICSRQRRRRQNAGQQQSPEEIKAAEPLKYGAEITSPVGYQDNAISHSKLFEAANVVQSFSSAEIVTATANLSNVIGRGGFGTVYKGILTNGAVVAVKVLSNASQQGPQEFLNEVALLSRVRHKNLVELVGYCIDNGLVLVYEFMPGGSLYDSLFGRNMATTLSWRQRLQILHDAAQGLAYLHTGCNSLIIHRDVKSSNILIGAKLEGKVSDFGISRSQSREGMVDFSTMKLVGSLGYLDPEYAATLRLTEKVDVYSFGVVLFEAMCGQLPLIQSASGDIHISQWVKPHYDQGAIGRVIDRRLGDEYNVSSVWMVAEVAMACVHYEGSSRPTMIEVTDQLKEALRLESDPFHGASPSMTGEFDMISTTHVQVR